MPSSFNPVALRLTNQQLVGPQFAKVEDVVGHMGAVQAQDVRMMCWAVAMRTQKPSLEDFASAYNRGLVVRMHLLRGTWQLILGEDYWWMLDLCAPSARRVIKGWMSSNRITISEDEKLSVRAVLEQVASEKPSVTKADFAEGLLSKGMAMDDHRLTYHLRFAELDGFLCSGDLLFANKATYALADRKMGTRVALGREEGLARLARKYFRSHSPATLEDYVWWSGLGVGDCRRGIALLGDELRHEHWNGYDFMLYDECKNRVGRGKYAHLLPAFDEYLIGYKSRDFVLSPEFRPRAFSKNGIFFPVVALNGIICGNWKPYIRQLQIDYFRSEDDSSPLMSAQWQVYRNYLAKV